MHRLLVFLIVFNYGVLLTVSQTTENIADAFRRAFQFSGDDVDYDATTPQMIRNKVGYECEEHDVVTPDGYILGVQRIVKKNNTVEPRSKRPVVFMMHGLLASSNDYVVNFPNQSLGFVLLDRGYDVWLGNARGNRYSQRHTNLTINDKAFWKFNWDEISSIDLPSMMNYVLNVTGQEKLSYVGHSMGTCVIFALLTHNQEFNDKVNLVVAMAPVARVSNIKDKDVKKRFHTLAPILVPLTRLMYGTEGRFLTNSTSMPHFINRGLCAFSVTRFICNYVFEGFFTSLHINETRIPVYNTIYPAGTSIYTVFHFSQEVAAGQFQKYDYGTEENLIRYGQESPPIYNVSNIKAPVSLFWSDDDPLADAEDVAWLAGNLPNLVENFHINVSQWTHSDVLYAIDANEIVFPTIIRLLQEYNKV